MAEHFSRIFVLDGGAEPTSDQLIQRMLGQAIAFFEAGSRCNADIQVTPNITRSLVVPAVVCYAFALELYVKLLLRICEKDPRKHHRVLDHYGELPADVKVRLIKFYNDMFSRSEKDFENHLTEISNAFEDWRYTFERIGPKSISPTLIRDIGKTIHNVIRQVKPEVLVVFENKLPFDHLAFKS